MQNRNRRTPALAAVAATTLGLVLSACGFSDNGSKPQPAPHSSTAPTSAPRPLGNLRLVFPETGTKHGVDAHGTSIMNGGKGVSYTCKPGLRTVRIGYGLNVMYNGVIISFQSNRSTGTSLTNDTPWYNNDQDSVIISFSASIAERLMHFHPIGMIVGTTDPYVDTHSKRKRDSSTSLPTDESVINMPSILGRLKLNALDYTTGHINEVRLCVSAS